MTAIIDVQGLTKTYKSGFQALKGVDLAIGKGEIFALLGPNGAGKTTLISIVCGIVKASAGRVVVDGADVVRDYRRARAAIGLVPQELMLDVFETVESTVAYSRGLFGKPRDPARVEAVLRSLSLWDKRKSNLMALSGGMKRRVMIAKALAHDPTILFLDEPTAGVDVDLRRDMWALVRRLRDDGVTVILTTHYIEEAEEMADRVGVIDKGQLVIVEEKNALIARLGRKRLIVEVRDPLAAVPPTLDGLDVVLADDGRRLTYSFDARREENGIAELMRRLAAAGIEIRDLATRQTTLEEIFVGLVGRAAPEATP